MISLRCAGLYTLKNQFPISQYPPNQHRVQMGKLKCYFLWCPHLPILLKKQQYNFSFNHNKADCIEEVEKNQNVGNGQLVWGEYLIHPWVRVHHLSALRTQIVREHTRKNLPMKTMRGFDPFVA